MTWLIVIIVVAVIAGLISVFSGEDFLSGFFAGGVGCGAVILQIFLAILGIALLFAIGGWLFG